MILGLPVLVLLQLAQSSPWSGIIRGHAFSVNTGLPLKQVEVRITSKDKRVSRSVRTGRDGAYEFPRLEPGEYVVRCAKQGYLSAAHGSKGPGRNGGARQRGEAGAGESGPRVARDAGGAGDPAVECKVMVRGAGFEPARF